MTRRYDCHCITDNCGWVSLYLRLRKNTVRILFGRNVVRKLTSAVGGYASTRFVDLAKAKSLEEVMLSGSTVIQKYERATVCVCVCECVPSCWSLHDFCFLHSAIVLHCFPAIAYVVQNQYRQHVLQEGADETPVDDQ